MSDERTRLFSGAFDDEFAVGSQAGNSAFFGTNVLKGLVAGIDDFIEARQDRWRGYRDAMPALLACAPWLDDEELLAKLPDFAAACVVMTKQTRSKGQLKKLNGLQHVNETTPGLPIRPFADLGWLAPKVDGQPLIVGPYGPRTDETVLPTIRSIGYRKTGQRDSPPLMHAKLVLLGHICWHEGEFGEEIENFTSRRLWISSANLTASSRRSLEFGYWTEDKALMEGAERFLVRLAAESEGLDPEADLIDPDLVPYEFDDEAMFEAMDEARWDDEESEP